MRRGRSVVATALAAALLIPLAPAGAGDLGRPNITDPASDANGVNDQGFGDVVVQGHGIGFVGDKEGGSFSPADIREVWFSNDHHEMSVHIRTTQAPTSSPVALALRVEANDGCLRFEALFPGSTYRGAPEATVRTVRRVRCGDAGEPIHGRLSVVGLHDTSSLTTLTFRLDRHPMLRSGSWIVAPDANSRVTVGDASAARGALVQADNTRPGISYQISFTPLPAPPKDPDIDKPDPPGHSKEKKEKKPKKEKKGKGHDKHGCDHPGKGHGHDGDCPEEDEDEQRSAWRKPHLN